MVLTMSGITRQEDGKRHRREYHQIYNVINKRVLKLHEKCNIGYQRMLLFQEEELMQLYEDRQFQ